MKPLFSITFLLSLMMMTLIFAIDLNAATGNIPLDYTYSDLGKRILNETAEITLENSHEMNTLLNKMAPLQIGMF